MPINSKTGNEQAIIGKMQIKEVHVTMATSHGSPPPGTCHTELSVENKCIHLDTHHDPRGRWLRSNQSQKQQNYSDDTTRHVHSDHPLVNSRSPR